MIMRILLDTNIAIWSVCDIEKIPSAVFEQISDRSNEIFISLASIWEIAIKNIAKPKKIPIDEKKFIEYCQQVSFEFLPIKMKHITKLRYLNTKQEGFIHRDPFDNIIVAQSVDEGIKLFTSDKALINYNYDNIVLI